MFIAIGHMEISSNSLIPIMSSSDHETTPNANQGGIKTGSAYERRNWRHLAASGGKGRGAKNWPTLMGSLSAE
jgi:hypothetical protein